MSGGLTPPEEPPEVGLEAQETYFISSSGSTPEFSATMDPFVTRSRIVGRDSGPDEPAPGVGAKAPMAIT